MTNGWKSVLSIEINTYLMAGVMWNCLESGIETKHIRYIVKCTGFASIWIGIIGSVTFDVH